ncbi:MAG: hypothetical protein KJ804_11110 [Proteobacteria bacterium]|nr:hypothetical protein [Pseudomonadota bacterium]MBU1058854.1 hypothetical protein [Pseudomonadota bacterium]
MQHAKAHKISSQWLTLLGFSLLLFWSASSLAASSEEIQNWLQAHNTYRILHNVPPVTWSATVAASAQAYANTCPSAHSNAVYGENLAWATYEMGESAVVQMWYDEEPLYDYYDPGFSSETGHFTQIVWRGTTEIGCGAATGCGNDWPWMPNVWVCQYNPPGNYIGDFAENVFPPTPGNEEEPPAPATMNGLMPILQLLLTK